MSAALDDHVAHIESKLASFRARPELHRHQIAAATLTLELARSTASPAAYASATGDLFELVRAEWLDRYFNLAVLHHCLENPLRLAAAVSCYRAGLEASGHADFSVRVCEGMGAARVIEDAADNAEAAVAPLLVNLLEWKTATEATERESHLELIVGYWRALTAAHPGCDWTTLCGAPRYRQRMPFDDDALALIGAWLAQALRGEAAQAPDRRTEKLASLEDLCRLASTYAPGASSVAEGDASCDGTVPTAQEAAAGYRSLLDTLDPSEPAARAMRSVCESILELADDARDAGELVRRIVENRLDLELTRAPRIALAEAQFECTRGWSQPHIEAHTSSLIDAMNAAGSTTEVEFEVAYHEACFSIESAWNELLLTYATRALRAALAWEHDPSEERRRAVITSYRASAEMLGLDWHDLLHTPRVWSFLSEVLHGEGQRLLDSDETSRVASQGEVGLWVTCEVRKTAALTLLARVRKGQIQDAADLGLDRLRFTSPDALAAHATSLFEDATGGGHAYISPGPLSRRTLVLWSRPVQIRELAATLKRPRRPTLVFPVT